MVVTFTRGMAVPVRCVTLASSGTRATFSPHMWWPVCATGGVGLAQSSGAIDRASIISYYVSAYYEHTVMIPMGLYSAQSIRHKVWISVCF